MSFNPCRQLLRQYYDQFSSLENDDPRIIVARTYGLSLSLSLGPSLISLLARGPLNKKSYARISALLKKELGPSSFAFAMTVAVGGGTALEALWRWLLQLETRATASVGYNNQVILAALTEFLRAKCPPA